MKKSTRYILLSVFALIVLIGLQSYSLWRIYNLEMDRIENQYRDKIREGLDIYQMDYEDIGFTTSYKHLDLSSEIMLSYFTKNPEEYTTITRKAVFGKLVEEFQKYRDIDTYIKDILKKDELSTRFKVYVVFKELELESWRGDQFPIYNAAKDTAWSYSDTLGIPPSATRYGKYGRVGSYFNCNFELYIDFSEMQIIVLREITGVLFLMILSFLIIGFIFIFTIKNMLEERRLSLLKTDFINNMTHELKTPLSTIAIASKTLENEKFVNDPAKVKNTVRLIGRQNAHLSNQINHLLEVSLWERRQFDLDKTWVNLHDFMFDLVEAFKMECKDHNISLINDCLIDPEAVVFVDQTQLATALHNLLINGVKYNNKDPELEVSCKLGDALTIRITDNGIGISRENTKHIFEKFYRVHTGNIHKVKGLGLGLFYVKQIVDAHGGNISLVSKVDKGSEFTIKLPINGRSKDSTGRR